MGYLQFSISETVSMRGRGTSFWYNDFWECLGVQAFTYDWLMAALNIINQSLSIQAIPGITAPKTCSHSP